MILKFGNRILHDISIYNHPATFKLAQLGEE
mgnify:CR=1 FL=1